MGWVEGKHYKILYSKPIQIEIYHGLGTHTVAFLSADRPQYLVAANIGYLSVDEAGATKYSAIEFAVGRLRDKAANYVQAGIFGAPQGLNAFADKADFTGIREREIEGVLFKERAFEVSTYENLDNLAKGYIERQLAEFGHNKAKVESWIYGKFSAFFEGSAYPDFTDGDIEHVEPHPSSPLVLTWDNNAPLAWAAGQVRSCGEDRIKKLCFSRESKGNARLIVDACVDFITQFEPREGWAETPIILDGDAALYSPSVRQSGSSFDEIISILKKHYKNITLIATRANPLQEVRVEAVNKAFSYGRVLISPNCPKTIKSFRRAAWKEGNERVLQKPKDEDINAYSDATGYHIARWISTELLVPVKKRTLIY